MKTKMLLIASLMIIIGTSLMAQTESRAENEKSGNLKKANGPLADFDKLSIDFGELNQNSPGTALFQITNKGNEPLVISTAKASCGCTNLTYSKEPILPGKITSISVTYNAAAVGAFTKTITVTTNASEQPVVLQINGKVVEKKK